MWMVLLSEALARPTEAERIERRVERALPDCAAVQARVDDPVPALLSLVEHSTRLKVGVASAGLRGPHAPLVEPAVAASAVRWCGPR